MQMLTRALVAAMCAAAIGGDARAATFLIDGSGSDVVASATGVAQSNYNFGAVNSSASSFSRSFRSSDALYFQIIWNNPAVPFMTGISTRDIVFRDATNKTVGFLRYAVNNNATANQYVIGGSFYDSELSGSYPTPQGTSVSYTTASEYTAPDIGFLDMAFTVRIAGSQAAPSSAPEAASWAMFIGGFGLIGAAMRRRRVAVRFG